MNLSGTLFREEQFQKSAWSRFQIMEDIVDTVSIWIVYVPKFVAELECSKHNPDRDENRIHLHVRTSCEK